MILPVNEIFNTIQGEAYWTGTPSTFVRLQGCPVGCPWCDTKHTWVVKPEMEEPAVRVLQKERDSETYGMMTVEQIVGQCHRDHVVLTGGEPCMYDLYDLTNALRSENKTVQIETSRHLRCDGKYNCVGDTVSKDQYAGRVGGSSHPWCTGPTRSRCLSAR